MPLIAVIIIAITAFFLGSSVSKTGGPAIMPTPTINLEQIPTIDSTTSIKDVFPTPTAYDIPTLKPLPTIIVPTDVTLPDPDFNLTLRHLQREQETNQKIQEREQEQNNMFKEWEQQNKLDCLEKQNEYARCISDYNTEYNEYLECLSKCQKDPYSPYKYGFCMCYKPYNSCIKPLFCH